MKKYIYLVLSSMLLITPSHASTNVQAKDVVVITSTFTKNLNATDNTVQKALNTIDQTVGSGAPAGSTGNLQTNGGSGNFGAYAGSTCSGQVAYAISANGIVSCTPYLTLSGLSATNPITYNSSTGAIGWTNSNNYITLTSLNSTMAGLTYNNSTGNFSLTSGYYFPNTIDQSNWNSKQSALSFSNSLQNTSGVINLVGDVTSPGASYYYGTNSGGTKGFFTIPTQVYPGAGVPNSTGSAWGSSYTVGTGNNNLVQLNGSGQLPAVSAANLTNFPTLNQNTTGNAATVTTNANLTGPITSTGNATAVASQTGTGSTFVMNTSPTLITPALGTPSSGIATNLTGTAAGLTAGNVTTNANLTGPISSIGNTTSITSQTGSGTKFVVDNSPTLITPNIGVATASSVNKVTITAPATSSTLTIADGQTLTATNSVNLNTMTDTNWCSYTASGTTLNCNNPKPQINLNLAPGTYSDGKFCTYSASGTIINCNSTAGSGTVTSGTLTANYLSKASTASNIVNSQIFDNGTNVGIGNATPAQKLQVSGQVLASGFNTTNQINILSYGAVCDDSTDDTTALSNALSALVTAGGGTLLIPGICKITGQITIDSVAFTQNQPPIRITGIGNSMAVWATPSNPTSGLDLQYNAGVAKILTYGAGILEIDHLTLEDKAADNAPFIFTASTQLKIHDVTFSGVSASSTGVSAGNDALIFGSTSNTVNPFSGYGTIIKDNFFNNIKRVGVLNTFANGIIIENNTVSQSCGNSTTGAFDIVGYNSSNVSAGNVIKNNIIEITYYKYFVDLVQFTKNNVIESNGLYDHTGSNTTAEIHVSSTSTSEWYQQGFDEGLAVADGTTAQLFYLQLTKPSNSQTSLYVNNLIGTNLSITANTSQSNTIPVYIKGAQAPYAAVGIDSYDGVTQRLYLGQADVLEGYVGSAAYYSGGQFRTPATAASDTLYNQDGSISFNADTGVTANTSFTPTTRMKILNNGNVGIGQSTPTTVLDLVGSFTMESGTTGAVLCLTSSHVVGHCTAAASCLGTCTCTCAAN